MPFSIVIQRNNSEENRVDKTLVDLMTLSGELRDQTSIINPVIMCEIPLADVSKCNYMTIPSFGRCYFVRNITSIRSGLVQFECHVDVISSFKTEIRENRGIIKKQENLWNLYLNDGTFRVYQNPVITTVPFTNGFTNKNFILSVAGG